jgi:hypothetical protein
VVGGAGGGFLCEEGGVIWTLGGVGGGRGVPPLLRFGTDIEGPRAHALAGLCRSFKPLFVNMHV